MFSPLELLNLLTFAQQNYLTAEQEAALNTLQLWVITGASIMLVLLMLWQIFLNNRSLGRLGTAKKKAQEEADQILADAREQAAKALSEAKEQADKELLDAKTLTEKALSDAKARAESESASILKTAELQAKEITVSAKDAADKAIAERRAEIAKTEERLTAREDSLEQKLGLLQERLAELDKRDTANKAEAQRLDNVKIALAAKEEDNHRELQRIAGLTADEARKEILDGLQESMRAERSQLIKRQQEETRQALQKDANEIMITAMQRCASDCVYEHSITTIPLPNEEMKGRIIGRDGRNIRTIEAATGANLLVDESPQAVVISCFDPVRREVARQVLEKLINDGRIHPSRIEEIVASTHEDLIQEIIKTGQEAADRFGLLLPQNLIQLLGTLKFRYSFSQNVLTHSIEVAAMAGSIAGELGLDVSMAHRAGLLHDIGKAVDHEMEGTHASLGAELLRRAGEDALVINAVAAHHEEVEKASAIAVIVQICDTLSAARPGARAETTEFFMRRLENLERIGNSFPGVENCYAIQAGRELRIMVKPSMVSDEDAVILAREVAERIESEMRYPGQIRVSVIRETRVHDYAK